ncbi:DUF6261 family protein [Aquimarina algiphila]|uniref:DUF6261 family protein n=1 Tax=Aquimarina algiphila TaxID=2047982 RepID=UPI00232D8D13|nr:DUF6261 family protein [Aquimarina algiphila]
MFTTPAFYMFRNSEFIKYLIDIKNIIIVQNPRALKIESQTAVLTQQITVINGALKKQLENPTISNTDPNEIDQRRDLAIVGIRSIVEAYTYNVDEIKSAAGAALLESIDKYGSPIAQHTYEAQNNALDNLLHDWSTILILKASIAILGLTSWVEELSEDNESSPQISFNHNLTSVPNSKINIYRLRTQAKKSYHNLINHIASHASLNPKTYEGVVREINILTSRYNTLVEKRKNTVSDTIKGKKRFKPSYMF